jgi:hypothetical protein
MSSTDLDPAAEHARLEREAAACKAAADLVAEALAKLAEAEAVEGLPLLSQHALAYARKALTTCVCDLRHYEVRAEVLAEALVRVVRRRVA